MDKQHIKILQAIRKWATHTQIPMAIITASDFKCLSSFDLNEYVYCSDYPIYGHQSLKLFMYSTDSGNICLLSRLQFQFSDIFKLFQYQ